MMEDHFGLERAPFRLGTDSSFYYEAEAHRRAMAHLRYGLRQSEGFVVITGEPGVGKTMVIEQLLLSVQDSDVLAGMLVPNGLTEANLAERVLAAFDRRPIEGIDATESLRDYLADERRRGAKASLVIDEAQHLSDALLEELRLLSDLTHDGDALLQVCLIGQTALRRVLFRDDMEQFRQRIVASYHLAPLNAEDTEAYIRHRMRAAGHEGPDVFTPDALGAIHRLTNGVPRRINTLCSRLLLQASMDGRDVVDADAAQGTADEIDADGPDSGQVPVQPPVQAGPNDQRPAKTPAPRPNLTLVETSAAPVPPESEEDDEEEAEAERALALVTAPPPTASGPAPDTQPVSVSQPVPTAPPAYALRAEGGGGRGAYPVTVGEINAAIQSIGEQSAAPSPVATERLDPPRAETAPEAKPRMASPQELMMRRPPKASAKTDEGATANPAPPTMPPITPPITPPSPAPEPATGDQERLIRAFLEETEGALAELRAAMTALGDHVGALDEQRRARRLRVERAVDEAKSRLDEVRLER